MKIQYYNKIRWGLACLAPNDAPPLPRLVTGVVALPPVQVSDES
jgi:hypothetical protein